LSDSREAVALARNDRFLVEIVEALSICPFARATRLSGQLAREVVFDDDAATLATRVRAHDTSDAQIVLLIAPDFSGDARAWERRCDEVRRADEAARAPVFAMAPFHPDTPFHTDTPARLVGLFRRTPDPTLQLVRFTALDAARRRAPDGKFFFDGSPASWSRLAERPERGLSEQIAFDNFEHLGNSARELEARLAALRVRS
jgi:hypothetical protein